MEQAQTLSVKQAAQRKGCTLKYVYDLLAAGRLGGAYKHGKRWCIPVDSVLTARMGVPSASRVSEQEPSVDGEIGIAR